MTSYPFYSGLPPHQSHSDTSEAAAASIIEASGNIRNGLWSLLVNWGPMTADELQERTGLSGSTIRPRLCELRQMGLIKDSGHRRPTRSNRLAVVHVAIVAADFCPARGSNP